MTAHTCHAHCGRACPPRLLMCPTCWALVPKSLGGLVYEAFRAGKRAGNHPNGAWMLAADAAIELVHLATGRRVRPSPSTTRRAHSRGAPSATRRWEMPEVLHV